MTLSTLLAELAGSTYLSTDVIAFVDSKGNQYELSQLQRVGTIQTTIPGGIAEVGPTITFTLTLTNAASS